MATYLLLVMGGNPSPSTDDVKAAMDTAGLESDDAQLTKVVDALAGKDLAELLEMGRERLAGGGGGGGGAVASGGGGGGGEVAGGDGPAEEVPEEPEEAEEVDLGGGMDMFGGGSDY
ncbi:MAG: 60S acidic ribosomal protein P2 [Bacteroidota bacterium]